MRIFGVLDIQNGCIVRGVAGQRQTYRPLSTALTDSVTVRTLCEAFREQLGLRHCYIADLDAIAGNDPHWRLFEQAAETGLALDIDAGVRTVTQAVGIAQFLNKLSATAPAGLPGRLVVGLETLASAAVLQDLLLEVGAEHVVFSLDLRGGTPITRIPQWREASAETIAAEAVALGVKEMIVLDLADVGVQQGMRTVGLLKRLIARHPHVAFTAGGGVRGVADLEELQEAGCSGALLASALHNGSLRRAELAVYVDEGGRRR